MTKAEPHATQLYSPWYVYLLKCLLKCYYDRIMAFRIVMQVGRVSYRVRRALIDM